MPQVRSPGVRPWTPTRPTADRQSSASGKAMADNKDERIAELKDALKEAVGALMMVDAELREKWQLDATVERLRMIYLKDE